MKKLLCKIGLHKLKIVLSRYQSFNFRKVTLKCERCGKLKCETIPQEYVYPFPTTNNFEKSEYDV